MTVKICSIISGGAGFIAFSLAQQLQARGDFVVLIDKVDRAHRARLDCPFICANLAHDQSALDALAEAKAMVNAEEYQVWHLAANSDIPAGVHDSSIDYADTFQTSYHIGLAMEKLGLRHLFFASSSAVYGDHGSKPIDEGTAPLLPISNYGAMKLASEAILSAFAEKFLHRLILFRFPNVVGAPATHGIIYDLMHKLKRDAHNLEVLGDGTQRKSYLHAQDLVRGMIYLSNHAHDHRSVWNIGPIDQGIVIAQIAQMVVARVSPTAQIHYKGGKQGWLGDIPKFIYNCQKLQDFGFVPRLDSQASVALAIEEIATEMGFTI